MSKYLIISLTILLSLSTLTAHHYYVSYTELKIELKIDHERSEEIRKQVEEKNRELLKQLKDIQIEYTRLEAEYIDYINRYTFTHPSVSLHPLSSENKSGGKISVCPAQTDTISRADCTEKSRVLLEEAYAGFADILKSNDEYAREAERLNAAYTSCRLLLTRQVNVHD